MHQAMLHAANAELPGLRGSSFRATSIRNVEGLSLPELMTAERRAPPNRCTVAITAPSQAIGSVWVLGRTPLDSWLLNTYVGVIRCVYQRVYRRVSPGVHPGVFVNCSVSCWGATAWGRQGLAPLRVAAPGPSAVLGLASTTWRPTLGPCCRKGQGHAPSSLRTAAGDPSPFTLRWRGAKLLPRFGMWV